MTSNPYYKGLLSLYKMLKARGLSKYTNLTLLRFSIYSLSCLTMAIVASIAVDSLISAIVENLIFLAGKEIRLCACVPNDLEKLKETFETIQNVLADAENKQARDRRVKRWLAKLKEVAYDADDILDEWKTEALRSEIDKSIAPATNKLQVCNFFSPCFCFNQIAFRCKMGHRIKDIRERLEGIFQEMARFNFVVQREVIVRTVESVQVMEERHTTSLVDKLEVFGRDNNKKCLIDLLLNESSNQEEKLSIISIVGMGGLGKTTLAQLAYNEESVKHHFQIRMWVCVSDDFRLIRLTKAMIESANKKKPNEVIELDTIQGELQQILDGKRFLLVLDDVWNEDGKKWDTLRAPLKVGAKGSRIVVTTRNKKCAEIMGTTPTHILDLPSLSDDHCWSLFCHKAFNGRSKEERLEFEEIGRQIVKKCHGLPLAVKTIGSVMHLKKTKPEWEKIRESEIWINVENDISPALMLSYQDLRPHLKQCFSYLSIFPKDYEIEKEKLIYMWMAQGYVLPKEGMEMEELGGSYFDELLWRSLLQYSQIDDDDGTISTCKMHDLISDLAQSISGEECSFIDIDKMPIKAPIKSRHSSLISIENVQSIPEAFCNNANHLRTLIKCIEMPNILKVSRDLLHYSRRLRVLDLSGSDLQEVPCSIENLKHLRYLDLSYTDIKKLPESMSRMCNLMFLNLLGCYKLQKLPDKMGEMISLRYLCIDPDILNYFPNGIGRIKSLRTLPFVVGDGDHQSKIGEIKNLNLLHTLSISHLERVANGDDAKEAALKEKKTLDTLKLVWDEVNVLEESEMERQVDVLEGLQPYTNLTRLEIKGYNGHNFPSWIGDQLFSTLTVVNLEGCITCQILPPLGQLPSLKSLVLERMENVKYVGREFYGSGGVKGFPKLEILQIFGFEKLEEWDLRVEEGEMPSLLSLGIINCPQLKSLPHLGQLPSLKSLYFGGVKNVKYVGSEFYGSGGVKGFPKLEKLSIDGFEKLEEWDLRVEEGEMQCLLDLEISKCPELKSLPHLGQLPSLKSLKLWGMKNVKYVGREFYGSGGVKGFPKLEKLQIINFEKLEEWDLRVEEGEMQCLLDLEISNCPELKSLPHLGQLPSLKSLVLERMENVKYVGRDFYGSGGVKGFPKLEKLEIREFEKLEEWDLRVEEGEMQCLLDLKIIDCPELKSLPSLGQLPSLKYLYFWGMENVKYVGREFYGSSGVKGFPKLEKLTIFKFEKLEEWDLRVEEGEMPSLLSLEITYCPELKSLPHLPSKLKELEIRECPLLKERCQEGGEDWNKIAHVQQKDIIESIWDRLFTNH